MTRIMLLLWTLTTSLWGQIILNEIMFDPVGSERTDEFVEILNIGSTPIDLSGWKIGDQNSLDNLVFFPDYGSIITPGQYAVILDPDYFADSSDTYTNLIPAEALLLTIETATFGSNGFSNSTPETVILVNQLGDTVAQYLYTIDNQPGFSDERIFATDTLWGNSRTINGTPGSINSISVKNIDLSISDWRFLTADFIVGLDLPFKVWIKNIGLNEVNSFAIQLIDDQNNDERISPEEIIETNQHFIALAPNDSTEVTGIFRNLNYGYHHLGLNVITSGEEDSTNNRLFREVFIDDPGSVKIVINEIQFAPETGKSEWVEIYNYGNNSVPLLNFHFADSRDTVKILTDREIQPDEFLILTGDSATYRQYNFNSSQQIVIRSFPNLNNDVETIRLMGPSGVTYDAVPYSSEWFGRTNVPKGTSLEKIRPEFNGKIASSWAASVAEGGSTPGQPNSVLVSLDKSDETITISPNPFSPDNDGHEDFAIIRYQIDAPTALANVRIFDRLGRMIRHLANHEPIASNGQFVWDGKDDSGRTMPIGSYICYFQLIDNTTQKQRDFVTTIILYKR